MAADHPGAPPFPRPLRHRPASPPERLHHHRRGPTLLDPRPRHPSPPATATSQADGLRTRPPPRRHVARREGWSVIVCLIGGGQEIYDGEGGLAAWGEALSRRPEWQHHRARHAIARPTPASNSRTALPYRPEAPCPPSSRPDPRRPRARRPPPGSTPSSPTTLPAPHSSPRRAASLSASPAPSPTSAPPCASAAPVPAALIASSTARRLRAEGLGAVLPHQDDQAVASWCLDRWPDIRSSDALEVVATEFAVQGLEFDRVGLCWDADLIRNQAIAWDQPAVSAPPPGPELPPAAHQQPPQRLPRPPHPRPPRHHHLGSPRRLPRPHPRPGPLRRHRRLPHQLRCRISGSAGRYHAPGRGQVPSTPNSQVSRGRLSSGGGSGQSPETGRQPEIPPPCSGDLSHPPSLPISRHPRQRTPPKTSHLEPKLAHPPPRRRPGAPRRRHPQASRRPSPTPPLRQGPGRRRRRPRRSRRTPKSPPTSSPPTNTPLYFTP